MKNFLKQVIATIVGILLLLTAVIVGLAASASKDRAKPQGILTIDLSREITDRGGATTLSKKVQGSDRLDLPLHRAIEAVTAASKDDKIKGILLHGGVTGGLSLLRELRLALVEFKKSGKKIFAWYPEYDDLTYYVASVADEVAIAPLGVVAIDGLKAEVLYFKDAIEKFGFDVQVSRVGKYKSAVEPLLLSSMSDANREQLAAMLNDMSETIVIETATSRKLDVATLANISKTSPMLRANEAVAAKLADRVIAFSDLVATLRDAGGEANSNGSFQQIALCDYASKLEAKKNDGAIAVVFAEGEIKDGEGDDDAYGDTIAKKLRDLRRDETVKAVVLRVNSPGGSASASEVILDEVRRLKTAGKPVVVSMGELAASGGYWISSLADAIVAHPSTLTGSIGVFGLFPNAEKLALDYGVHREVVKTAPFSDSGSMLKTKSPEEMAHVQHVIDGIYDDFLSRVAEGRGKQKDAVHEIAQGRVWTGKRALELGLVDKLGTLDDAIVIAAEKAKLGKGFSVRYDVREGTALGRLVDALDSGATPLAQLPAEWRLPKEIAQPIIDSAHVFALLSSDRIHARLAYLIDVR